MASTQELKEVIKETLDNKGTLGQIKARLRAEIFNALDNKDDQRPKINSENLIINELIREYLDFNNYKYASSVLTAECGQSKAPLDREFLARELNLQLDQSSKSVPLLYSVLSQHLKSAQQENSVSSNNNPVHKTYEAYDDDEVGRGIVVNGGR